LKFIRGIRVIRGDIYSNQRLILSTKAIGLVIGFGKKILVRTRITFEIYSWYPCNSWPQVKKSIEHRIIIFLKFIRGIRVIRGHKQKRV
jgi:hypothetical protein